MKKERIINIRRESSKVCSECGSINGICVCDNSVPATDNFEFTFELEDFEND